MAESRRIPLFYTSLLYFIGFALFLEWLYPIGEIDETSDVHIFILYALLCMFITMFSFKWWFSTILKGAGLVFAINYVFFPELLFTTEWVKHIYNDVVLNVQLLISQDWYNLTPLFKSLLFLFVIWLMSYLIYYWFVVTRKFLLFVVLTFIYLSILDTFTVYNAGFSMIRTFIFAFVALGVANYFKELNRESLSFHSKRRSPIWIIPVIFTVLFSSFVGYAAPKSAPQWADPVPFIESMSDQIGFSSGKSTVKKSGYGDDDSQLGGSFIQDHSPVFDAYVTEEQYWRVETKDVYTGKGWKHSSAPVKWQTEGDISLQLYSSDVELEANTGFVEFHNNSNSRLDKLPYSYETLRVHAPDDVNLQYDSFGAITPVQHSEEGKLEQYGITYFTPKLNLDNFELTDDDPDLSELYRRYIQVPETLPDRVAQLAEEITEQYDTLYDKVQAIESYFNRNGFEYETDDVPVPDEDVDYVDQFLFETKYGYCDNFSTSMVVMLRTLGIPARWAKGFTAGELVDENVDIENVARDFEFPALDSQYDRYEITNANAHSWVEVYFPNVGWVPFEPTQGFSNYAQLEDTEEDLNDEEANEPVSSLEDDKEFEKPDMDENVPEAEDEAQSSSAEKGGGFTFPWLTAAVALVLVAVLYMYRIKIKTAFIRWQLKNNYTVKTYERAYTHLLHLLYRNGFARKPDQTLREYAKRIDHRYRTEDMEQLTALYEQMIYNKGNDIKAHEVSQLWENLVKRVMA